MERKTFLFENQETHSRVWRALGNTMFTFGIIKPLAITVFGKPAIDTVEQALIENGVEFCEV